MEDAYRTQFFENWLSDPCELPENNRKTCVKIYVSAIHNRIYLHSIPCFDSVIFSDIDTQQSSTVINITNESFMALSLKKTSAVTQQYYH